MSALDRMIAELLETIEMLDPEDGGRIDVAAAAEKLQRVIDELKEYPQ